MKTQIQSISFIFFLFFCCNLAAQVQWVGDGDGTSWNDPANWNTGSVPTAADTAEINTDVTLTGDLSVAPKRIKTGGQSTIKLHLNMNLDNVAGEDHAFVLGAKCIVEFGQEGTPYTFNFATADNKHGILANNSADSSTVIVMRDATLNFNQHNNAINMIAAHCMFENNGTINMGSGVKTGIRLGGQFINAGVISISEAQTDGIAVLGGSFINTEEGVITLNNCSDDAIEIRENGSMSNLGSISASLGDEASSANNAIAVGTEMEVGSFANVNEGDLVLNAGINDNARAIYVFEMGTLTNTGSIHVEGGNTGSQIYSRNTLINDKDGYIFLVDGRINANMGTFENNGFIESTREGAGVFTNSGVSVTNNAFFKYNNANVFGIGEGDIVDNGLRLNNNYRFKADAEGNCTIDIANVSYDWTIGGSDYASSEADGTLTFLPNSIAADSVVLKTSLPEVNIKVINICMEAVGSTSTTNLDELDVKLFPTILPMNGTIYIEGDLSNDARYSLYNSNGQLLQTNNAIHQINLVNTHTTGVHYLKIVSEGKAKTTTLFIN